MVASKFLKLAAGGVAIAAIAIGVGVGTGIYSKNKKIEAAAATSIGCRRILQVPGIDIEDNAADAHSTRSKLLARSLGGLVERAEPEPRAIESYESAESWYGDAHAYKPAPSGHGPSSPNTKSKSSSKGPYGFTSTKGTSGKGPKGSSTSGVNSYGPKGHKSTTGLGSSGPKGSKSSKGLPVRSYCSLIVYLLFFGRF